MPKFSQRSLSRLATCDPALQRVFEEIIKDVDCTIIEGHRDEETQNAMFDHGKSQLRWPHSKHNSRPSRAVDVAPFPIDWNNLLRFAMFAGYVKGRAHEMGITIRCGIDWNGNLDPRDNWIDAVHFELVGGGVGE